MRKELSGFIRDAVQANCIGYDHHHSSTGMTTLDGEVDFERVAGEVLERMDELTMACSHEVSPGELALYEGPANG